MKTKLWLFLTFCLILPLVFQPNPALAASKAKVASPQDVELTYGFVADSTDPQLITAVLYPNVSSSDATISTAAFSFLLPAGTVTEPSIAAAPAIGSFTDINGIWSVQKLTASVYASVGFDAAELGGKDLYQAVLDPGSATPTLNNGQPVPLFSFRIAGSCGDGAVEVLTNDSALQQALLGTLSVNFNNQISVSVDGLSTMDQYVGNFPGGSSVVCPGGTDASLRFFLPFVKR